VPHAVKKKQKLVTKPESNSRKQSKSKKTAQVATQATGVKTRFEMKRASAPPGSRKKSKDNNKSTIDSIPPESLIYSLKHTMKTEENAPLINLARRGSNRIQDFKKSITPGQTLNVSARMPSIPLLQLSLDNPELIMGKSNSLSRRKEGFFKSKEVFSKTLGGFAAESDSNKHTPSAPEQTKNLLAKLLGKLNQGAQLQNPNKTSKKRSELDKSSTARDSNPTRQKTSSLNATSKLFRTQNAQWSNAGNMSLTIDVKKALQGKTGAVSGRGQSPPSRAGQSFHGTHNLPTPKPASDSGNYFLPLGMLGSVLAATRAPPKISGLKLRLPLNKTLNTSGQRDHSRRAKD